MTDINCSCDIYLYDCERPSVYRVATYFARRKEHRCIECCEKIKIGDKYEYVFGVWDGEASQHKTCMRCVLIRDKLFGSCSIYGELREQVWDCLGLDYITNETIDD